MRYYILLCFVFITYCSYSQDDDWMIYDQKSSNAKDSMRFDSLDFDQPNGEINIKSDPRVNTLIDFMGSPKSPDPVLIEGFRVQITYSQDKGEAQQVKMKYLRNNDSRAYMDYLAPNFRIRVGNFKTRLQAEHLKHEIINEFPGATVVKELIELPELEECDTDSEEDSTLEKNEKKTNK